MKADGFFLDAGTKTLFCNGKQVVATNGMKVMYWFHPNKNFISVQFQSETGSPVNTWIYCESELGWERLTSSHFVDSLWEENPPDGTFCVLDRVRACDRTRSYFVGRRPAGPLPDAHYLALFFYPIPGNPPIESVFVMPDSRYCKITSRIYYYGNLIPDANAADFKTYSQNHPAIGMVKKYNETFQDFEEIDKYQGIATDGKDIFVGGMRAGFSISPDFRLLSRALLICNGWLYKLDGFSLTRVPDADIQSFSLLNNRYALDAARVYYLGNIVEADRLTFSVINEEYARDERNVYLYGKMIEGADPESFTVLERGFACDHKSVYIQVYPIKGAYPATFRIYPLSDATIMRLKIWHRRTEEQFPFAYDNKYVYCGNSRINGADPRTFDPEIYLENLIESDRRHQKWLYDTGQIQY